MALALAVLVVALGLGGFAQSPAAADLTAVKGGAEGYRLQVSLFGGPVNTRGVGQVTCSSANPPTPPGCVPAEQAAEASSPSVVLPSDGGRLNQSKPEGAAARSGPATFFSSGQLDVATQGGIGPDGSVSSATQIVNINREGSETFTADAAESTCSASGSGVSASTSITAGTLQLDSGDDGLGTAHDPVVVTIPPEPDPNTTYEGHIHVNGTTDSFRYVFNEQAVNSDGSITVYAAHQYLLGPTAVGDLSIGKAECGVTGDGTDPVPSTLPNVPTTLPVPTTTPPTTVPSINLTQLCNPAPIVQPNDFSFVSGASTPYPSPIVVSGLTGAVTDVEVSLLDFTTSGGEASTYPNDMDILAAAPDSSNVILMSDAGGDNNTSKGSVAAVDLTFDDEAAEQLPANDRITTGTWRPVDDDGDPPDDAGNPDTWPAPAPPPMDTTLLSTFDGINPNGVWNLFANDDQVLGTTQILGGWCLNITTTTSTGPTTTTTGPTTTTTVPTGPALTLDGPATATVGCQALPTVTARLLVNGFAEANATVTFSVAGPGLAAPPSGTATTGGDGRATFTFTAAQAGDYTVTATASRNGVEKTATHTVHFDERRPNVTVDGPTTGQTEEATTVTATVDDACGPLPGALVNFAATWPAQDKPWTGQATPSSATATTDADGKASFTFSADRAGNYAVTASVSLPTGEASATHTVRMDILSLKRVASIPLGAGDLYNTATLMDPAGRYAYVVTESQNRTLRKIDLATFQVVGGIALTAWPMSAVIDPAGRYAYVVVEDGMEKIDLVTLERVGTIPVETGPGYTGAAPTLIDPAGSFAYVGSRVAREEAPDGSTSTAAGVVKVDLNTFQRVGAIHFADNEAPLVAAMDPAGGSAYLATERRLVRVDLATFSQEGSTLLAPDDGKPQSALIDPAGDFAYIGTVGKVVKFDLPSTTRVGEITLGPEQPYDNAALRSAVMDPKGAYAYFGKYCCGGPEGDPNSVTRVPTPNRLVKIDLRSFEPVHALTLDDNFLASAVSDPTGSYAYIATESVVYDYTTSQFRGGTLVKIQLRRPPNPALTGDDDAYATGFETPLTVPAPGVLEGDADADGDPLVAGQVSDPDHGSVALDPDGSFTYTPDAGFTGTDTFTYTASDGMGYSAPATVSVEVAPPAGPKASSFNYSTNVSLFGGPSSVRGYGQDASAPASAASPSAMCSTGSGAESVTDPDGAKGQYGPAVIFGGIWPANQSTAPPSGPLTSSVDCVAGDAGHATASTSLGLMPPGSAYPGGAGPGPVIADQMTSTCTARTDGTSTVSTTIVNGILETSYDRTTQEPATTEPIPVSPPINYTRTGTIDHVGDRYRVVFNEQISHPDGSRTVNAAHMYLLGPTAVGDMIIGQSVCGIPKTTVAQLSAATDFDGNGTSDVGVYRPDSGAWFVQNGLTTGWGAQGDVPVPADYDGNGTTDVAVYRPSDQTWYVQGGLATQWGTNGDVPVPGDYNGDGKADIAVYRPSDQTWYVQGGLATQWGANGDVPVPGDYDGNGTTDIAVFRPADQTWYVQGGLATQWGTNGDVPVSADFNGDGKTDVAVYRPADQTWYSQGAGGIATQWGTSGDIAVPGDYNGDGHADVAVFRRSDATWYVQGGLATQWGAPGDIPLAVPAHLRSLYGL